MVKDGTDTIISNIVYQYKPIAGAPLRWPGKKGLKDLGDHYNERVNKSKGTEEGETNRGIFTQNFWSIKSVDKMSIFLIGFLWFIIIFTDRNIQLLVLLLFHLI